MTVWTTRMDNILELRCRWNEYQYEVKKYEQVKENQLREKNPNLSDEEIDEKVLAAVERKFKNQSQKLLTMHVAETL